MYCKRTHFCSGRKSQSHFSIWKQRGRAFVTSEDQKHCRNDHDYALNDHDYALNDHDYALNDHDYALNNHDYALNDHDYALNDHDYALNDHDYALNDHDYALNDHDYALNDHDYALNDHDYALNDHDYALNDHDYALNDHDYALNDHDYALNAASAKTFHNVVSQYLPDPVSDEGVYTVKIVLTICTCLSFIQEGQPYFCKHLHAVLATIYNCHGRLKLLELYFATVSKNPPRLSTVFPTICNTRGQGNVFSGIQSLMQIKNNRLRRVIYLNSYMILRNQLHR